MIEQEYLSPKQVAKILGVSEQSVRDWFRGRRGVLDLGTREAMHKRRRRCLRISRAALNEFITEKRAA